MTENERFRPPGRTGVFDLYKAPLRFYAVIVSAAVQQMSSINYTFSRIVILRFNRQSGKQENNKKQTI